MQNTRTDLRLSLLVAEAERRVLYVSPPYADPANEKAFLAGYKTALEDIARGHLFVEGITR